MGSDTSTTSSWFFTEPLDSFTVVPEAYPHFTVGEHVLTLPVLLAIGPIALVLAAISPLVDPVAMLLVELVETLILAPIFPDVGAVSMHVIVEPLARILPSIDPGIGAITLNPVLIPVAIVDAAVRPEVRPLAMLLALEIVSLVPASVCPDLLTGPMLQVLFPVAFIPRPVHVHINPVAVGLIIKPLALKHVPVHMPELTPPTGLVQPPKPLIPGAIRPNLYPESVLHAAQPLPFVHRPILEYHITPLLDHQLSFIRITLLDLIGHILYPFRARHVLFVIVPFAVAFAYVVGETATDDFTAEKSLDSDNFVPLSDKVLLLIIVISQKLMKALRWEIFQTFSEHLPFFVM